MQRWNSTVKFVSITSSTSKLGGFWHENVPYVAIRNVRWLGFILSPDFLHLKGMLLHSTTGRPLSNQDRDKRNRVIPLLDSFRGLWSHALWYVQANNTPNNTNQSSTHYGCLPNFGNKENSQKKKKNTKPHHQITTAGTTNTVICSSVGLNV